MVHALSGGSRSLALTSPPATGFAPCRGRWGGARYHGRECAQVLRHVPPQEALNLVYYAIPS